MIGKFVPPLFDRAPLDMAPVERDFARTLRYAANGRSALYRIAAGKAWRRMLVPTYVCATIIPSLHRAGIEPVFFDIDPRDLNADIDSMEKMAADFDVPAVLLPSLYGNPADLLRAHEVCRKRGIFLIDDAAQSFGARLASRPVGSFGNAGFFSFSPGKPLAGHMGAFFWSDNPSPDVPTSHDWMHWLKWQEFRIRRLNAYASRRWPLLHPTLEYGMVALGKLVDVSRDRMAPFEDSILGGLLKDCLAGRFAFRQIFADKFSKTFAGHSVFDVVGALRGTPANHKIVLRCHERTDAVRLRAFLGASGIYAGDGYPLLCRDGRLENALKIEGCVVELPIEDSSTKMDYMMDVLSKFGNA